MATGLRSLGSLRGAVESAEGDSTTPTRLLPILPESISIAPTLGSIEDRREWAKGFDGLADVYPGIEDWTVTLSGLQCSFEDAGWWWTAFMKSGSAAPTTVDTSAYSRTFTPNQSSSVVGTGVESLHLQYSATDLIGTVGWSIPGLVGQDLALHFRKRASGTDTGVTMDITLRTASAATLITAFTGSLSDRAQTLALGQQLSADIDSSASSLGTTADNNVTEADLTISRPAIFHDGMIAAATHTSMHRDMAETSLSIVRKFSDLTEYNAWKGSNFSKTLRAVRIEALGAIVGAVSAKNTLRADWVGKWDDPGQIPELIDGLWYQRFSGQGIYDATVGGSVKLFTQNNVSAAYDTA